jgi:hypothetical protein
MMTVVVMVPDSLLWSMMDYRTTIVLDGGVALSEMTMMMMMMMIE